MKKGKFLLGALLGAAAGVLLSPVTGSEARRLLAKKFNELKIKVQDVDFKEVREEFEIKVEEIQEQLADLDEEKALKLAKEKAKEIQAKSEDLVEYAIKKGKPALKEIAADIKMQTTEVLKEVLDKLEASEKKTK